MRGHVSSPRREPRKKKKKVKQRERKKERKNANLTQERRNGGKERGTERAKETAGERWKKKGREKNFVASRILLSNGIRACRRASKVLLRQRVARRVQRKPSSKRGTRTTRTRVTPRGRSVRVCDEVEIQRVQETFGEDRKEGGRKGGGYASGRGQGDSGDPRRH